MARHAQNNRPADTLVPAGLVYVAAEDLTITRQAGKLGWRYFDGRGKRIADRDTIDRLNAAGLPPAYQDGRFADSPNAHLQAIGIDARGRRQYRYHPDFRAAQESGKFDDCRAFGAALAAVRKHVEIAIKGPPLDRDTVIAAVVRILDRAYLRVGNEAYAAANKSFGATTLRNRHAKVESGALKLSYRGKSGVDHEVRLSDKALLRIVRRCQDLPGQRLFQYRGEDGEPRQIGSSEVNAWLRKVSGADFTAKHFRTFHASVEAFAALRSGADLKTMLENVSGALGNTPAIARKSYIHPRLIAAAKTGELEGIALPRATKYLTGEERGLIAWLSRRPRRRVSGSGGSSD
jgi:DNA topoisomerase I